jgi:lysozyme
MNLLIICLLTAVAIGLLVYLYPFWKKPSDAHYKGFGIRVPQQYELHGIDVSKYQERINWPSVAAMEHQNKQLKFAFIKATQGIAGIDPYFKVNWLEAKEVGMIRGAYMYFHPAQSAMLQAKLFTSMVGDLAPGDFHPVVDIECEGSMGCEKIQASLQACLNQLEQHYGVKPIIYTNPSYYKDYLKDKFNDYPLWVSHYGPLDKPRVIRDWHFWQHSEKGNVQGISGDVDFNVFKGTMDELRQFCIKP